MKKLLLIAFTCSFFYTAKAQTYVNIPDPVFRQVLDSVAPGCIVGTTLNTSHPGLSTVNDLFLDYRGLTDITGVQYLGNLWSLMCTNNQISFIPQLPWGLSTLMIGGNQITTIPSFIASSFITDLRVGFNPITTISNLPANLYQLDVSGCSLNSLPNLPSSLGILWCYECGLTSLPPLPQSLYMLECGNNELTSLPTLPNDLQYLYANGNDLWCIPNLPTNPQFYSSIGTLICTPQGTPDTWFVRADMPISGIELATAFSIGSKVYIGGGSPSWISQQFWELNTLTNTWTQKANVPIQGRLEPVAFSIGNKGYFGMGQGGNPTLNYDLWQYDPVTNSWTQKSNYPGTAYMGMASFVIGDKAYVGCGIAPGYIFPNAFYQFDPAVNTWTPIANFPSLGRREAACFTLGNKGYVCAGDGANSLLSTSYSYNPATNSWSSIASTPSPLNEAASFAINGKGYIAGGQYHFWNGTLENQLLEYNPITNSWVVRAEMPTLGRMRTTGCAANGRGYVGTGLIQTITGGATQTNDWWEYSPICATPTGTIYASGGTGLCSGDSVMLYAGTGNNYQWKRYGVNIAGGTSPYLYVKVSGNYTCFISNSCGSASSNTISVIVNTPPTASISAAGPITFCASDSVILNANTGAGLTYQWLKFGNPIIGATGSSYAAKNNGKYKVVVTNNGGCSRASNMIQVTTNPLPTAVITAGGPISFCAGDSVILSANNGAGLSYQWKKFANNIAGATSINYIAKTAGKYKCIVTGSNGCSRGSNSITVAVPCREVNPDALVNVPLEWNAYPNPSADKFIIEANIDVTDAPQIQIIDQMGKVVNPEMVITNNRIEISGLPAGIYFATITTSELNQTIRLVRIH